MPRMMTKGQDDGPGYRAKSTAWAGPGSLALERRWLLSYHPTYKDDYKSKRQGGHHKPSTEPSIQDILNPSSYLARCLAPDWMKHPSLVNHPDACTGIHFVFSETIEHVCILTLKRMFRYDALQDSDRRSMYILWLEQGTLLPEVELGNHENSCDSKLYDC